MAELNSYWTPLNTFKYHKGKKQRLCRCVCGVEKYVDDYKLRNGVSKSCGCKRGLLITEGKQKHNMSKTRIYRIWQNMKKRCSPAYREHYYYYDKGITVCNEWLTFEKFCNWAILNGYKENLSIDRIDNSKGYYPENCRWTDNKMQSNNRDFCISTTLDGIRLTATELSEILGVSRWKCAKRIKDGMTGEEIRRELYE